jgi:hypothetical protein
MILIKLNNYYSALQTNPKPRQDGRRGALARLQGNPRFPILDGRVIGNLGFPIVEYNKFVADVPNIID